MPSARYFVIMVVDVVGFGRRPNPTQLWLRRQLYAVVGHAVAASAVDFGDELPQDRGDGAIWLIPGTTPKVELSGRFVDRLHDGLREYGQRVNPDSEMRLRVAFHAGEVAKDEHGWAGEDLNTACRLVDLAALKDSLAASPDSVLGVAVSEAWHSGVIRHGYPEVQPEGYRRVDFRAKEVESTAWIRIPGREVPPGLDRHDPNNQNGQNDQNDQNDVTGSADAADTGNGIRPAPVDGDANPRVTMTATARENGRIYMAARDQIITGG